MNRKVITAMLLSGWFVLAMSIISCAEEPDNGEINPLSLHLEIVSDDANHSEQQLIVQLTAKNEGTEPLLLPRLQEGFIEKYGWWWGWSLHIFHLKEGKFQHIDFQELYVLYRQGKLTRQEFQNLQYLSEKDLFTLLPGEKFSIRINLANAKQYNACECETLDDKGIMKKMPSFRLLQDVPGEYEIRASLVLYAGNAPDWYLQKGWSGSLESNTVTIVIGERSEQEAPNTPDESTKK